MQPGHLEQRLYSLLHELMRARGDVDDPLSELVGYVDDLALVETFEDADLLTAERGLVITTDSCQEFHVTITQRR